MKAVLENIESNNHQLLEAYTYENSNFDVPLHFHSEYELVYIVEGYGSRYVGNRVEPFTKGDLVLIAPNIPHCWINEKENATGCKSLVVQWKSNLVAGKSEFKELEALLNGSERGLKFIPNKELVQQFENTIHSQGLSRYINFLELLLSLAKNKEQSFICSSIMRKKISTVTSNRLNTVFLFIENNYQNKIRLHEIASLIGLSEAAFSRFFSKSMRTPFFSYLNEYRIQQVCKLLQEKDISVSDASCLCGFESLPYFHRQFQKYKNISPLQYKKQYLSSYL